MVVFHSVTGCPVIILLLLALVESTSANDDNDLVFGDGEEELKSKYRQLFSKEAEPIGTPDETFNTIKRLLDLLAASEESREKVAETERQRRNKARETIRELYELNAIGSKCRDASLARLAAALRQWADEYPSIKAYLSRVKEDVFAACRLTVFTEPRKELGQLTVEQRNKLDVLKEFVAARVPDEAVFREHYLVSRDDRISATLVDVVNWRAGEQPTYWDRFAWFYRLQFKQHVAGLCRSLPNTLKLSRETIELFFTEASTIDQIDRSFVDWAKTKQLCQEILKNPTEAADIVFAYKWRPTQDDDRWQWPHVAAL